MQLVEIGNIEVFGETLNNVAMIQCDSPDECRELAKLLYQEVEVKRKD
jgi:hypothetical protein